MTSSAEIERTISKFADAAHKHYQYTLDGNSTKTNRQAKRLRTAFKEVRDFGDLARQALLQLTQDEDAAVASMAAVYSLKYAPDESLAVLEKLGRRADLLGFEARQAVLRWQEGTWQLE